MLTRGDEYPLHQTAEPIAYAGTDRNFYDRYFFNGYAKTPGDMRMFAVAFGVYPHLNIADAAFCWMAGGKQINLHASCWLGMERMAMRVGPIAIAVIEPLQHLRVSVDSPEQGIRAEIDFAGRSFPIEEPRFTRRIGPRSFLDYTRLTQNGGYAGWIEIDGVRTRIDGFVGTRDRSWGVRPIGARDPQGTVPPAPLQFFWLWSPCIFDAGDLFFHTNDDASGHPWNRRAVWAALGSKQGEETHLADPAAAIDWRAGTRNADAATLTIDGGTIDGGTIDGGTIGFAPEAEFFMAGLGYGHARWAHGLDHGELAIEREDWVSAAIDRALPHHFHVQALSRVTWRMRGGETREGRGVLEQLAIGPHTPSGFASLMDLAA